MLFPTQFTYVVMMIAIAILIYCTYKGYKDGFVMKLCELLSTMLCVLLAWFLSGKLSGSVALFPKDYSLFGETILNSPIYQIMNRFFLFLLLFIIARIVIIFIRPIFRSINWVPFVGGVNKLLGSILGFWQGFVILIVITFVFSSPLFANGDVVLKNSHLSIVKDVYRSVMIAFDDQFERIESVQKIVTPSSQLLDSDVENIKAWLVSQGFSEEEQIEVMELIKQRNGQ
ncbi:MAG: CvpA family protein [Erysipelotrichia bacterium]|nr:CvpA family protein [Erysipelotrichia bacterium]NCC53966.1 CvpA family protein [Erysipelotrichia bacterium]